MALARLLGVCVFSIGVTASHAQVIPPFKPPDGATISEIALSPPDKYYSDKRIARRKNTPRIVFVPGILGSKIDECRADGSQCTNVWGTTRAVRRNDVDLSFRSDRVYRTDVVDSLFFKDIYGGTLDYIRRKAEAIVSDSTDDALVTVFHYDWRLSNGENAKLLKERICLVRAHAESSPIVIVAHSMGGLMTKVWAARHAKEACADGKKPDVKQIVFVATPHLGSPKAIKAIAEGYNIFFDELTGLKQYLGWWERNYVLDAINQAGISFPSLYELLPIRTSEYCIQQKPALAKASVPVVGDDNKPVNLFDVDTWRRYDLLRRIGAPSVRRSYYEHDLAPLLQRAEQLLCEIADFDPATVVTDVVYLFGREKADRTYGWFHLHSGASDSIDSSTTIQGDGTVPIYSAQNFLVSSTWQTTEVQADHTSIINSATVLGLVDDLYVKAIRRADLQTARASAQYAFLLIAETAASGKLISVSLDPEAWPQGDDKFAIEINTKALAAMGYKTTDVALIASTTPDAFERARLYAVAASSTDEPTQRLTWIGDVARSSYEAARFQDAIRNSAFVAATVQTTLPSNDPKAVSLQKAAKAVEGWAYLRGGDLGKFNELASSYAAKYAVTKDEFKEPTSPLPASADMENFVGWGSSSPQHYMVYSPPRRTTWGFDPLNDVVK
jgi:pimeloyl-ACP methyl ester carboxylesterase